MDPAELDRIELDRLPCLSGKCDSVRFEMSEFFQDLGIAAFVVKCRLHAAGRRYNVRNTVEGKLTFSDEPQELLPI